MRCVEYPDRSVARHPIGIARPIVSPAPPPSSKAEAHLLEHLHRGALLRAAHPLVLEMPDAGVAPRPPFFFLFPPPRPSSSSSFSDSSSTSVALGGGWWCGVVVAHHAVEYINPRIRSNPDDTQE